MRFLVLRYLPALAACALLGGCGPRATATLPAGSLPQDRAAWSRSAGHEKGALLYVSDPGAGTVTFYSYPGLKPRGTLTGLSDPLGLCVDPATQDVWVVDANARALFEFERGGTAPVRKLSISAYYPELVSCAVNPKNGDLGVLSENLGSDPGALMIFADATGRQTDYQSSKLFFYNFVTYDKKGNAFVDGYGDRFALEELPYGATSFRDVTPKGLRLPHRGGVQSDGARIALGNEKGGIIYQIAHRKVLGKTHLENACRVLQFFLDGDRVIAPDACGKNGGKVSIYKYPAGGAAVKVLGGFKHPFAVVISR